MDAASVFVAIKELRTKFTEEIGSVRGVEALDGGRYGLRRPGEGLNCLTRYLSEKRWAKTGQEAIIERIGEWAAWNGLNQRGRRRTGSNWR